MLERMIVDISKWIVIIVIFFVAFACSLYFIFSPFAVISQSHESVTSLANMSESYSSISLITNNTGFVADGNRCPNLFGDLMRNKTKPNRYIQELLSDDGDLSQVCKKSEDYEKKIKVGGRPAIHYFGKTFGATVLTTFFTLFGVIAEDGIPVRMDSRG